MLVIGLGTYSRTGKSSLAGYLVEAFSKYTPELRVLQRPLAWKLKQISYELYAWAGMRPPEHYETKEGERDRDVTLPDLDMTPVELWVALGTKAIRNNVYDATWLDYLFKTDHQCDVLIVPDVRFPNEAAAIRKLSGVLIKVVRPGYGPRNTVADRALLGYDDWDYVLGGDGKLDTLRFWARRLAWSIAYGTVLPLQTSEERAAALAVEVLPDESDESNLPNSITCLA